MSEDILAEYIKNKIDELSATINNQFNPSFLFEYLFPQPSIDGNKQAISMEILPNQNIRNGEMNYVTLTNIESGDRRQIQQDRQSPQLEEGFGNIDDMIPEDIMSHMYFASLGVLGIYILFGLMRRIKMIPE